VTVPATRAVRLAATVFVVLLLPAGAQAKTKNVDLGLPKASQTTFQNLGADVNDFFPHTTTIHAGDKVRFRSVGFHTLDIPGKNEGFLPLITPTGQKISAANDANNAPFWFNGLDQLNFNPAVAAVDNFGKSFTYKNKRIESGLPLAPKPKPITVRFKKKGTYTYYCDIHAGMKGKIVVKRKHAKIPTAKQDKKRLKAQIKRALARAKQLPTGTVPANTIYTGNSASGGVEYFGMLPSKLTVTPGTTVKFMMSPKSFEVHTASFGPGDPNADPSSYLGQIAASFEGPQLDQRGLYPSEQPPAVVSYTTTLHGNGFWNSGVMDTSAASAPANSNSVKFDTPGTYDFYCLIHPFMHGQVVVQP
jgi:plastocyanin